MSLEIQIPHQPTPEHAERSGQLTAEELKHLGHLCVQAMERDDLEEVARQHVESTGTQNPNVHGKGLLIGEGDIPMSDENVYRSVDIRAIDDLIDSGVVRGAYTATEGKRANTKGHSTYWNNGESGKKMKLNTTSHFIIEASRDAAENGWVKASDIRGIHARDTSGEIHDITKMG